MDNSTDALGESPSGPNALALEWMGTALRLDEENRELRAMLTALLFWLAERSELLDFVRVEIARRWPTEVRPHAA